MLAAASNGIIIGFNVRPDVNAKRQQRKKALRLSYHG